MSDENRHNALDRLAGLVPVDAVVRNVDVQAVVDRIDLDAVWLGSTSMRSCPGSTWMPSWPGSISIRSSPEWTSPASWSSPSRGAASGSLDVVRAQSVRLDGWITTRIDRLLRRKPGWRPSRPAAPTGSLA